MTVRGFSETTRRGKGHAEFRLTALAYNFRRTLNIVGFVDPMAEAAAYRVAVG
jgi:hypothetical protein